MRSSAPDWAAWPAHCCRTATPGSRWAAPPPGACWGTSSPTTTTAAATAATGTATAAATTITSAPATGATTSIAATSTTGVTVTDPARHPGEPRATTSAPAIVPERTALLVMHYQTDILRLFPAAAPLLLANTRKLCDAARRRGVGVYFAKIHFSPGYPEVSPLNKNG